ncbi:E3 ubiquitin-protein ligase rbbp6 [Clonorchis sinensis]|uniref:E3 ubiquitin-protein ligase rbbp6 n=1 Tax=Clonorchis sinensis TaxID=79923 RepID=A0A3R7CH81_CLOSI|nr:E3 ubiquitin-protein ligase rbbp6 [Clonorchis sinensis]
MSSIVYFKFKANVKTDSIPFDGSSISVKDLKNAIRTKCCLYSTDFDLKLEDTNGKSYNKDDELIPKYTSIVVRRVPKLTTEVQKKKPTPDDLPWRESVKNATATNPQVPKHVNLADSDLPEEEKIKIMMERSSEAYSEKNFAVKPKPYGVPPAAYICHKCGLPGHWIHNCPGVRDKTGKMMDVKSVKRPTGIPQDFLLEVDAGTPGAYLGKSGKYMVPIKDAEAYAQGKKDKRPFSLEENPPYVPSERKPPKQFICPLCNDMFRDAVLVSCCGTTYCNECILGHVFDSQVLGSHKCPNCGAVLTDHESSVFENALVRSMIRDWLANEAALPDSDASVLQPDIFKMNITEKAFINNRRVLKPKQALSSTPVPPGKPSDSTSEIQKNTASPVALSEDVTTVENVVSSASTTAAPSSSDSIPVSSTASLSSPIDSENVELDVENTHAHVVQSNTCTAVVASAPCTTLVGSSRQPLLGSTSGLSSSRFPCISYSSSTAVVPTILPSISGGSNPLLNALYNLHVENLQQPVAAPQVVLPMPFQGPLIGGPEWAGSSALAVSVPQPTGLVDPLLQVTSNQPAYGLTSGQPIPGSLNTAPLQALDGHKVLSKEEFYRLKMEMLHSARIRHRHRSRSRSRSPSRSYRRTMREPHESISRRHDRSSWERRFHRRSPGRDYEYDEYRRRFDRAQYRDSRSDRMQTSRLRYRSNEPGQVDSEPDRGHILERRYVRDKHARTSNELRHGSQHEGRSVRGRSRSESRSPIHRTYRDQSGRYLEPDLDPRNIRDTQAPRASISPVPISVVPQYDETSEPESADSKAVSHQENGPEEFQDHVHRDSDDRDSTPLWIEAPAADSAAAKNGGSLPHTGEVAGEILTEKRNKKEKKHKKHKHKHRSEKKKEKRSRILQALEANPELWIASDHPVQDAGDQNATVSEAVSKKHKKHKKHKHEDKLKKKAHSAKHQVVTETTLPF